MLKPGAGAPKSTRPSTPSAASGTTTSRSRGALIAVAVVLLAAVLFFALRGGRSVPEPAGTRTASRARESSEAPAQSAAPRAARAARKSALRPRASASASAAPVPPVEPEAPPLDPKDVSDPALKAVLLARDDRSPSGTQVLLDNLGSSDSVLVAEATRALIARRATEAIAPLAAIGLEKAAGSGLSVIDALGKLGGAAAGNERSAAVDRLLQMLRQEKQREAPETPGNLLQIYEALGDTQDPRAVPALEAELLDATVPRAPKVVIVQALVDIGLASSKDALSRALAEQSAQKGDDDFEEEIRQELVATIEEALETL